MSVCSSTDPVSVSLTGHLSDPKSAVRAWFARRLPRTKPLVSEANRALRTRGSLTSAVVASGVLESGPALPATANDQRLVGTTLDLLVRTTLADDGWSAAPTRGALRVAAEGAPEAIKIASEITDPAAAAHPGAAQTNRSRVA